MLIVIALVVCAVLLAGIEVLIPGGFLGVLSAGLVIAAGVFAYQDFGAMGTFAVFGASLVLIVVVVFAELKFLANSKYGNRLFLRTASDGRVLSKDDKKDLSGKKGIAITVLGPTGVVEVDGKQHEAFSQDGHLQKGDHVKVVSVDNFRVVVKRA